MGLKSFIDTVIVCKIQVFKNAKELGQKFWTSLPLLAAERYDSHCCRLRLRGKGYFASRINRYTNSASSFQLVRLVISGSICPNPGPVKTSASTKPDKQNRCRFQSNPLQNINIAHLNIRSLKNNEHYILAKEAVCANKIVIKIFFTVSETWLDSTVSCRYRSGISQLSSSSTRRKHPNRWRCLHLYKTRLQSFWYAYVVGENPDQKCEVFLSVHCLQASRRKYLML